MKALLLAALVGALTAAGHAQTAPNSTGGNNGNTGNNNTGTNTTGTNTNQNPKTEDREDETHRRFWRGNLPGGQYMVALDKITSISRHSYTIVEAGMLVDEVVIDTIGRTVARFYFVRPLSESANSNTANQLTQRAKELLDYGGQRAGTNAHNGVVKNPQGLYAGTVEYRVTSAQELGALYGSVQSAWMSGRGRIFSIK